jgi:hypothetical protein
MVLVASGPIFMFCAPELIFDSNEGAVSNFHVLHSRTRFGRYYGRRVLISCFALLDSFPALPKTPVQFLCFAHTDPFWAIPRASGPVLLCWAVPKAPSLIFMFCAPVLAFDGSECVGSHFHILRSGTRFGWYRGRRVPFSYVTLPNSFSAVPRASGVVFMFCAPGPVLGCTEGAETSFHVLLYPSLFRR